MTDFLNSLWTFGEVSQVLPKVLMLAWKHRERIFADSSLYMCMIPHISKNFVPVPLGLMLRCWGENDGLMLTPLDSEHEKQKMYVYHFGGFLLSGTAFADAINLETGETARCGHLYNRPATPSEKYYSHKSVLGYVGCLKPFNDELERMKENAARHVSFFELLSTLMKWEMEEGSAPEGLMTIDKFCEEHGFTFHCDGEGKDGKLPYWEMRKTRCNFPPEYTIVYVPDTNTLDVVSDQYGDFYGHLESVDKLLVLLSLFKIDAKELNKDRTAKNERLRQLYKSAIMNADKEKGDAIQHVCLTLAKLKKLCRELGLDDVEKQQK